MRLRTAAWLKPWLLDLKKVIRRHCAQRRRALDAPRAKAGRLGTRLWRSSSTAGDACLTALKTKSEDDSPLSP